MMIWAETDPPREVGEPTQPITVTAPNQTALLADLRTHLRTGRGFAVATMNLDHVVKLRHDPAFRAAYSAHSHITADGRPIVWLSRLAGQAVNLVTGSDLLDPLIAVAAAEGAPVALVGSTQPILDRAAAKLEAAHPGLDIVARIAPAMGFQPDGPAADAVIAELRSCRARMCFLALGAPKQELFAAQATEHLPQMGFASIGAGLDFIAGAQHRAPRLMRALAVEWVWRLMRNPGRLGRRYGACLALFPRLLVEAMVQRHGPRRV